MEEGDALLAKAVSKFEQLFRVTPRPSQQTALRYFVNVLNFDEVGILQRVTAAGKSLLIAFVVEAALELGKKQVIVACPGLDTQMQLGYNFVAKWDLKIPGPCPAFVLYGRDNYWCTEYVTDALESMPLFARTFFKRELVSFKEVVMKEGKEAEWFAQAPLKRAEDMWRVECGEDETPFRKGKLWKKVKYDGACECEADACPRRRANACAKDARVVVTSSALLLARVAHKIGLPSDDTYLVIDEAHLLLDSAGTLLKRAMPPTLRVESVNLLHTECGKRLSPFRTTETRTGGVSNELISKDAFKSASSNLSHASKGLVFLNKAVQDLIDRVSVVNNNKWANDSLWKATDECEKEAAELRQQLDGIVMKNEKEYDMILSRIMSRIMSRRNCTKVDYREIIESVPLEDYSAKACSDCLMKIRADRLCNSKLKNLAAAIQLARNGKHLDPTHRGNNDDGEELEGDVDCGDGVVSRRHESRSWHELNGLGRLQRLRAAANRIKQGIRAIETARIACDQKAWLKETDTGKDSDGYRLLIPLVTKTGVDYSASICFKSWLLHRKLWAAPAFGGALLMSATMENPSVPIACGKDARLDTFVHECGLDREGRGFTSDVDRNGGLDRSLMRFAAPEFHYRYSKNYDYFFAEQCFHIRNALSESVKSAILLSPNNLQLEHMFVDPKGAWLREELDRLQITLVNFKHAGDFEAFKNSSGDGKRYLLYGSKKLCTGIDLPGRIDCVIITKAWIGRPDEVAVYYDNKVLGNTKNSRYKEVTNYHKLRDMVQGAGRMQRREGDRGNVWFLGGCWKEAEDIAHTSFEGSELRTDVRAATLEEIHRVHREIVGKEKAAMRAKPFQKQSRSAPFPQVGPPMKRLCFKS